MKILPGVRLNLSRSGLSWTLGPRGLHLTVGGKYGPRATVGLPGSGISYTTRVGGKRPSRAVRGGPTPPRPTGRSLPPLEEPEVSQEPPEAAPPRELTLVDRLFMSGVSENFADAVYDLYQQDPEAALAHAEAAVKAAPGAAECHLLAALAARELGEDDIAIAHLETVLNDNDPLPGPLSERYAAGFTFSLAITEHVTLEADLSDLAAALTLAELYQAKGRLDDALELLAEVRRAYPDEPYLILSSVELNCLAGHYPEVTQLLAGVSDKELGEVAAACRFYQAQALWHQGLGEAALTTIGQALKAVGDDPALEKELLYGRAVISDALGRKAQSQRDFQRLYALDPDFRDVAQRINTADQRSR